MGVHTPAHCTPRRVRLSHNVIADAHALIRRGVAFRTGTAGPLRPSGAHSMYVRPRFCSPLHTHYKFAIMPYASAAAVSLCVQEPHAICDDVIVQYCRRHHRRRRLCFFRAKTRFMPAAHDAGDGYSNRGRDAMQTLTHKHTHSFTPKTGALMRECSAALGSNVVSCCCVAQ